MDPNLFEEYMHLLKEHKVHHNSEKVFSLMELGAENYIASKKLLGKFDRSKPYKEHVEDLAQSMEELGDDQFLMMLLLVQDDAKKLQMTIDFDSLIVPKPYIAGVFPTGSFNAQAMPVNNGALLLLNFGLFSYIRNVLNLMSFDAEFEKLFHPTFRNMPPIMSGLKQRQLLSRSEIAKLLLIETTTYLLLGHPFGNPGMRMQLTQEAQVGQAYYTRAIELFALAHEFAHLILGHLDENKTAFAFSKDTKHIKFFTKSQVQELDADVFAVNTLMMGSVDAQATKAKSMGETPPADVFLNFIIYFAAPILFFLIDNLTSRVRDQLSNQINLGASLTHPSSETRIGSLLKAYGKIEQELIEPAVWCIMWFEEIQSHIMQLINKAD